MGMQSADYRKRKAKGIAANVREGSPVKELGMKVFDEETIKKCYRAVTVLFETIYGYKAETESNEWKWFAMEVMPATMRLSLTEPKQKTDDKTIS